jgi:hypothetical protein
LNDITYGRRNGTDLIENHYYVNDSLKRSVTFEVSLSALGVNCFAPEAVMLNLTTHPDIK